MENVAHSMVGLAAAKAGLERLSPGATTACIIAANIPDSDVLAGFGGRWFVLEQHRGISHSILAVFLWPILIAGIYKLGDLVWERVHGSAFRVRFWPLYLAAFVACATHPILDWTNNYGVRPFLPWNGRWFYGDLVFIVDPWIWVIVGGCVFVATSTSRLRTVFWLAAWGFMGVALELYLSRSMHPARVFILSLWLGALALAFFLRFAFRLDQKHWTIARAGLVLLLAYWVGLAVMHHRALERVAAEAHAIAGRDETVYGLAATPTFADPFFWQANFETDKATYRFDFDLSRKPNSQHVIRYARLTGSDADMLKLASTDPRAKVFLGFARFPVEVVQGKCPGKTLVEFADLRYTQPQSASQGGFAVNVEIPCDDSR